MKKEDQFSTEFNEDAEFETMQSFDEELYEAISPKVKQFLAEYYGDQMLELQSETYREIESIIKRRLYDFAEDIPDILFRNRIIEDMDEFEQALEKFIPENKPINWPVATYWFDKDFSHEAEETYWEDVNPKDLTDNELRAKRIIESVNESLENTRNFADFLKTGYEVLNKEVHLFLETRASFDLAVLSAAGFEVLESHSYLNLGVLLEDLFSLMPERQ
jgi:hypothetical protein